MLLHAKAGCIIKYKLKLCSFLQAFSLACTIASGPVNKVTFQIMCKIKVSLKFVTLILW